MLCEFVRDRFKEMPLLNIALTLTLSSRFGADILLAHEYLQTTGAFKLRGAMNAVLQLPAGTSGVTAVSTGNHGRALAYSARQAGVPCIICMSELVPENKLNGIRALGAEARIIGKSQDEAEIDMRMQCTRRLVALGILQDCTPSNPERCAVTERRG